MKGWRPVARITTILQVPIISYTTVADGETQYTSISQLFRHGYGSTASTHYISRGKWYRSLVKSAVQGGDVAGGDPEPVSKLRLVWYNIAEQLNPAKWPCIEEAERLGQFNGNDEG
jgi:hypothetical protein